MGHTQCAPLSREDTEVSCPQPSQGRTSPGKYKAFDLEFKLNAYLTQARERVRALPKQWPLTLSLNRSSPEILTAIFIYSTILYPVAPNS